MKRMSIPTLLTLLRLVFIPIFVALFYLPMTWGNIASAAIFALAGITDWLDGFLARKLNQASDFGAFLDPVADKLIIATALVLLAASPHLPFTAVPAAIIVGREIAVSALREWMAEIGKRASIAVTFVSKVKTAVQFFAILFLLVGKSPNFNFILLTGYALLYLAAGFTLWTMIGYIKTAWPNFEFNSNVSSD